MPWLSADVREICKKVRNLNRMILSDARGIKRKACLLDDNQAFLNSYGELTANCCEHLLYREADEPKHLPVGNYEEPFKNSPIPHLGKTPWTTLSPDAARDHVMAGGSLLCEGAPGTGKTWWARELVRALRAAGKRVDVLAKCHVAVQSFGEGAQAAARQALQRRCPGH